MKITKIFTFDSSHMLDGHDGKCQNLHGHTYKLEITVSDDPVRGGPKDGMVMDFTDLKAAVEKHITDPFDHAFIYNGGNERECQIAALLELEHENPVSALPHHCRKYGGRNVRPFEKRGVERVQREIVGNADIVCGV